MIPRLGVIHSVVVQTRSFDFSLINLQIQIVSLVLALTTTLKWAVLLVLVNYHLF